MNKRYYSFSFTTKFDEIQTLSIKSNAKAKNGRAKIKSTAMPKLSYTGQSFQDRYRNLCNYDNSAAQASVEIGVQLYSAAHIRITKTTFM